MKLFPNFLENKTFKVMLYFVIGVVLVGLAINYISRTIKDKQAEAYYENVMM